MLTLQCISSLKSTHGSTHTALACGIVIHGSIHCNFSISPLHLTKMEGWLAFLGRAACSRRSDVEMSEQLP